MLGYMFQKCPSRATCAQVVRAHHFTRILFESVCVARGMAERSNARRPLQICAYQLSAIALDVLTELGSDEGG